MLLTSTMFFGFLGLSIAALAVGIFSERNEVYYCGIILMLFTGLLVLQGGINNPVGETLNQTTVGNTSLTTTTTTYQSTSDYWTNGFGLLLVVIAAGLSLSFYKAKKDKEQQERDSIDIPD